MSLTVGQSSPMEQLPVEQPDLSAPAALLDPARRAALEHIQRRILWLATSIIHHANHVRPNPDGTKVGGHQASSASMVTILTALYFLFLQHGDRVSIKPHSAPAFHAVQYLLGQLPREYLTSLRAYGGLQAYPSRTKDPVRVDFSTGSVGFGAVAPAFAALAHRYTRAHFEQVTSRRFIALLGDAELDEGNIWEAILDDALDNLENLIWIVDLNRQSLDRVVPGIRAARIKRLFLDNGWQVLEAKYGRKLQALFAQPGGDALRQRIDEMSNEEYQALIRMPGDRLRTQLIGTAGAERADIAALVGHIPDDELPEVIGNLGGHDLEELLSVLEQASSTQPTVIFAYTIKGWLLPIAAHPLNHAMLISPEQVDELRAKLAIAEGNEWDRFDPASPEGQLCAAAAARLFPDGTPPPALLDMASIPTDLDISTRDMTSTQDAFGRVLVRLADLPTVRERMVTAAPDVSVSTNLAGWINKVGVFSPVVHPDYETESYRLMKWQRSPAGQHIELGISEMNLFTFLGMFGLAAELCGQHLIPIGTVYDPFVCRGLDALIYGLYSGAKFIFAGTPSGISLSPEGGAHQSSVTASLGAELPSLNAYEPCFAREVEWLLLEALRQCCDRAHGRSTYLRLSTRPIDQQPFEAALQRLGAAALQQQVLDGGYRLIDWRASLPASRAGQPERPPYLVHIAATGAILPEAVAAAAYLQREEVAVNVLNLTSPRRLFETWQAAQRRQIQATAAQPAAPLGWLIPPAEQQAPIITVHDAASHSLAWLGSAFGTRVVALGVDSFGQSGTRAALYQHYGISSEAIIEAAFAAIDAAV